MKTALIKSVQRIVRFIKKTHNLNQNEPKKHAASNKLTFFLRNWSKTKAIQKKKTFTLKMLILALNHSSEALVKNLIKDLKKNNYGFLFEFKDKIKFRGTSISIKFSVFDHEINLNISRINWIDSEKSGFIIFPEPYNNLGRHKQSFISNLSAVEVHEDGKSNEMKKNLLSTLEIFKKLSNEVLKLIDTEIVILMSLMVLWIFPSLKPRHFLQKFLFFYGYQCHWEKFKVKFETFDFLVPENSNPCNFKNHLFGRIPSAFQSIMKNQFQAFYRENQLKPPTKINDFALGLKPSRFFETYDQFLEINLSGSNRKSFNEWRSRITKTLHIITQLIQSINSARKVHAHLFPYCFGDKELSSFHAGTKKVERFRFNEKIYIGLKCFDGWRNETINLNRPISKYFECTHQENILHIAKEAEKNNKMFIFLVNKDQIRINQANIKRAFREKSCFFSSKQRKFLYKRSKVQDLMLGKRCWFDKKDFETLYSLKRSE